MPHVNALARNLCYLILLSSASTAAAEQVAVPLTVDLSHVHQLVERTLEMDADGRARYVRDDCNALVLRDLRLTAEEAALQVELAVTADAGTTAFGRCIGPATWEGLMQVRMQPTVDVGGLGVSFKADSAELRRPDGSEGLLTRPARLLAEHLVLPRLDAVRIDLAEPLAAIDALIVDLVAGTDQVDPLTERAHVSGLEVLAEAIALQVVFEVEADAPTGPEPPLDPAELAQWQRLEDELDGLLTAVVTALARQADDDDLRLALLGALLDARLAIAVALVEPDPASPDPVRDLFLRTWEGLRPHVTALAESDALGIDGLRLAAFISGADAIAALDALGSDYGVEISRDGLRRLARLLLADEAPASLTPLPLAIDQDLRRLLGLPAPPRADAESAATPAPWLSWLLPAAHADEVDPAAALRGVAPEAAALENYLALVGQVLDQEIERDREIISRLPDDYRPMLDPLVRATAWKESCWRHYLTVDDPPEVIRSPIGSVGIMQINQRVWRGVYDVELLVEDVRYNTAAGIEILVHYLVDYALRKGEHEQPGGTENLVRATYAAYNGGPGQLARYRQPDTPSRLKAIDAAFWKHYQQMQAERWPDVGSCY